MTSVVISQPMFFPWVGLLEQIRLAKVFIYYDDVQFSKGSFVNRVQIKTARGQKWLTVPLRDLRLGQRIKDVLIDDGQPWRDRHVSLLADAYSPAPFRHEMLELVQQVYAQPARTICDIAVASMSVLCRYFSLADPDTFRFASCLDIAGAGSQRVLDIVRSVQGSVYITGHGARDYLAHESFESDGVSVEYMDYRKVPYPQLHGEFTPFVSALDLVANLGQEGRKLICSPTRRWKEFLYERAA